MVKEEYVEYLDELRRGGEVNMFGAVLYLMKTLAERHPK
jgi:hypothetical protein